MCGFKIKCPMPPAYVDYSVEALEAKMEEHVQTAQKIKNIETGPGYFAVEFEESFNPNSAQKTKILDYFKSLSDPIEVETTVEVKKREMEQGMKKSRAKVKK
jgi:uncharacterized protein YdcH (DUF465 family)